MEDRHGAAEVGKKDDARLQQADQQRVATGVVERDLLAQLGDTCSDLPGTEIDVPDAWEF
jgi:hypothetical protein